jgi:hypothetical protein
MELLMSEIVVIIRPSFMKFCEDGCRAALFNHLLYWIAKKTKGEPQSGEITYYATTDELVEQMAGAWGYQKVRREVNELIDMGLIDRGKNPSWGADRTKHFHFGKEQCGKLLELCQKHSIDLSKIGLPPEITNLIKQFINPSNAIYQSVKSPEHEQFTDQSVAIYQSVGAITKNSTKDSFTKDTERKNERSEQTSNVPALDTSSHSFTHSQSSLQEKTDVVFSSEAEQVYQLAKQLNITYLKRDEKHRDNCILLAEKGVTTQEKMESLIQHCRQVPFLQGKTLNLKNLVNEVAGWLQMQRKTTAAPASSPAMNPFSKATAEREAKLEEIKKKVLAQDAARGGPRPKLRERFPLKSKKDEGVEQ